MRFEKIPRGCGELDNEQGGDFEVDQNPEDVHDTGHKGSAHHRGVPAKFLEQKREDGSGQCAADDDQQKRQWNDKQGCVDERLRRRYKKDRSHKSHCRKSSAK